MLLMLLALVLFSVAMGFAWMGWLGGVAGLAALALVGSAFVAFAVGRRRVVLERRRNLDRLAKLLFTVGGLVALLRHPIPGAEGSAPLHDALVTHIPTVDPLDFALFGAMAMGIKLVGVVASSLGWHLLVRGQGIRVPYGQTILTGFLIGRFIGTFLPSTLGLDGYTTWEVGRVSGRWHRVVAAKLVEKVAGATALFAGVLCMLPVLYGVLGRAFGESGPWITVVVGLVAASVVGLGVGVLLFPGIIQAMGGLFGRAVPEALRSHVARFTDAASAYRGRWSLLLGAFLLKVVSHVNTAIVYWCTALAIGVTTAAFLPIVAGSLLQIVGTLLSPTIGGEGAREALQALLLADYYDSNPAKAVLAGALGFIAAEAATLWGGAFLWTRNPDWRPTFCEVDGEPVDVGSLGAFDLEQVAAQLRDNPGN